MINQSFAEGKNVYVKSSTVKILISMLTLVMLTLNMINPALGEQQYKTCRVTLLAVLSDGRGATVPGEIRVIYGGKGLISTSSGVGEDVAVSFNLALMYASVITGVDYKCCNYYLDISANVGGLSATLLFFIALLQIFQGQECSTSVSATGIIGPGGIVGAVAGLEQKLLAAQEKNLTLVYIPGVELQLLNYTPVSVRGIFTVYDFIYEEFENSKTTMTNKSAQIAFRTIYENLSSITGNILHQLESVMWRDEYYELAHKYLEEAFTVASHDRYYVASSLAYAALVNAYISKLAYLNTTNTEALHREISSTMEETLTIASSIKNKIIQELEVIAKTKYVNPAYLDLLITTYTRASEAEKLAIQAKTSFSAEKDVNEAIYITARAWTRALSALGWFNVTLDNYSNVNETLSMRNVGLINTRLKEFLDAHVNYLLQMGIGRRINLSEKNDLVKFIQIFEQLLDISRDLYTSLPSRVLFISNSTELVRSLVTRLKRLVEGFTEHYNYYPLSTLLVLDLAEYYLNLGFEPLTVMSLIYTELPRLALYMLAARAEKWVTMVSHPIYAPREVAVIYSLVILFCGLYLLYSTYKSFEKRRLLLAAEV
jgi:hypothetical protein